MHEKIFSEAFNVPPSTVFGLRLRNYAIGHELALVRQGNPVITYTEKAFDELSDAAQRVSLANAVELCCYKIPRFKFIWAVRSVRLDFSEELKKFREYRLSGSMDMPTVKQPRVQGAPFHYFGAPETARLLNYVSEHHAAMIAAHFEGSPLNFPLGLARLLYLTHLECEGSIWIENFQDVERQERKAAFDKLHPETGIAVGDEAVKESARKWNAEHPDTPVPE